MKTLDTRDLAKRKDELEGYRDTLEEAKTALADAQKAKAESDQANGVASDSSWNLATAIAEAESEVERAELDFGEDEAEELAELETLEDEISEWRHGETLILERDFEDYARELADDICDDYRARSREWPFTCIDWEQAARELAMDYSTVTYQGEDYYVRS